MAYFNDSVGCSQALYVFHIFIEFHFMENRNEQQKNKNKGNYIFPAYFHSFLKIYSDESARE